MSISKSFSAILITSGPISKLATSAGAYIDAKQSSVVASPPEVVRSKIEDLHKANHGAPLPLINKQCKICLSGQTTGAEQSRISEVDYDLQWLWQGVRTIFLKGSS